MGVRGKRKYQWVIATYCDYGAFNRRSIMGRHYSEEAAAKAWKRYAAWHAGNIRAGSTPVYRVWQERRDYTPFEQREIVNDTGNYGHKTFA
jgi:hypothetical protein